MKKFVLSICFLLLIISNTLFAINPPFLNVSSRWADSIISRMTLDEKIGQLIMVTAKPWLYLDQEQYILEQIEKYKVGGVLFLKSSPTELASLANKYQKASPVPLFIAIDAENGLSFRMDSVVAYPQLIALGALTNDSLIYRMGREIGEQCKVLGVNLNFAPVGDINSNPENPVINYRSFGENAQRVARKSWMLAKGLQDEGIIVSLKHFPGHGNTSTDSHHTLPSSDRNYKQLDSIDFVPFKMCIDSGINGIMSAHIQLPETDKSNRPATLSKKIMTNILKDSLKFKGLVFSDAMNMKGVNNNLSDGDAAVEALKAGVDVLEYIIDPGKVVTAVKIAVKNGILSEESISKKCRNVLMAKKWSGLDQYRPTELQGLNGNLNKPGYLLTSRLIAEQSLTLIKNDNALLPLQRLDTLKIASFSIGSKNVTSFQNGLERYTSIDHFTISADASSVELSGVLAELKNYNMVIVGIHGTKLLPANRYNISELQLSAVEKISAQGHAILVFFASPYSIGIYPGIENSEAIVVTNGENEKNQDLASQLVFGAIGTNATLPVTISEKYKAGFGIENKGNNRLKYTLPEEAGFDSRLLKPTIDSLVNIGIMEKMFPGCQVLVAKSGMVIFHETYGFLTYDSIEPVVKENLYDWASVTKITGPLPILMKLYQDSVINLDVPFSNYWVPFKGSNKEKITLREILAHQARLKPGIIFHDNLIKENRRKRSNIIRDKPSPEFAVRVSSNLYVNNKIKQKMFDEIMLSGLLKDKKYAYSDLGFYLFPELIAQMTGVDYEKFLQQKFLAPLGANTVTYNPYNHYPLKQIVPTERDDLFRKELIRGFVHDEGAALLGGVSGNAGLFGTANDMAKIMQFYLQKGNYGDLNFLNDNTIDEFSRIQYSENDNRRGLGFDKPYLDNQTRSLNDAYPAPGSSPGSFGHSGYTGVFTWADPDNQLLFIFMTNRICPTRKNTKLTDSNFRPILHQSILNCKHSFLRNGY